MSEFGASCHSDQGSSCHICCVDYSKPWQVSSSELEMLIVGFNTRSVGFTLVHRKVVQHLEIPPMRAEKEKAAAEREESVHGKRGQPSITLNVTLQ